MNDIKIPMTVKATITSDTGTALVMVRYPYAADHQLHAKVVNTRKQPYVIDNKLDGLIIRPWPLLDGPAGADRKED
jgi:hypothetical protein